MSIIKQRKSILVCILAVLILISGIAPNFVKAEAGSGELKNQLDLLEEQKADIDAQIEALEGKLTENMGKMEEIVAQKNVIDQEIFLLYKQIDTINAQISTYGLLIADKQEELDAAQARQAQIQQQNKTRIRAMEKNGQISYWAVLFKANSFIDLLDRMKMIREIAQADKLRLEQMRLAAEEVAQAKAVLETEKDALQIVKEELNATQTSLEAKRAQADQLLAELLSKGEEFEMLLHQSEKDQADLMEQIAQKEEEYEDAKYQEWLATSVPETTSGAGGGSASGGGSGGSSDAWLVPISYTYLSSPFGYRYHPLSGEWRMHYGVDLAAPMGTPIYATRSGVVTTASYEEGGAGYYVSINHGDGYASIYMHMTHFIVSAGEYVSKGQVIGYCGTSGGSTGPHLHFGISYQGTYVNPADYISIS